MKNMKSKKIILLILIFSLTISLAFSQDNAEEFRNRNGNEWYVKLTSQGLIFFAYRLRPDEKGSPLSEKQAIVTAKNFLDKNSQIIGLENFVYTYDQLNHAKSFSYWTIDFKGEIINELTPPHTNIRVFMTNDGQVYAIGDVDFYTIDAIDSFQKDTITEDQAIESAKNSAGINSEVTSSELITKMEINETAYPFVWDIKFNNKEVLVDAKTGKVLSIKENEKLFKSEIFSNLLSYPFMMTIFFIIIIGIIFIMFLFTKKIRKSRNEYSKIKEI